jgi:hypothetical protein
MIVTFFGATIIGVVKMYFMKGLPDPPEVVAKQLELLLDRNFQMQRGYFINRFYRVIE